MLRCPRCWFGNPLPETSLPRGPEHHLMHFQQDQPLGIPCCSRDPPSASQHREGGSGQIMSQKAIIPPADARGSVRADAALHLSSFVRAARGEATAERGLIAWMLAGLGRQPGLWAMANHSCTRESCAGIPATHLQPLPSHWENSQGSLEEHWGHWGARGRFWGIKTAKRLHCSSGDASQFTFSNSSEGALGIWENKRRKPHVCRCTGRGEAQWEGGELAPKLAADGQAAALGAPASSSEQKPGQQSEGLGEKYKKNLQNLAKSSVPCQESTKEEAQKSAGHFLGPLPEVRSPSQQRCAALAAFLEKLHGKKGKCQWVTGTESGFCQEQRPLRLEIDVP